jgi:HEAT repeat protein
MSTSRDGQVRCGNALRRLARKPRWLVPLLGTAAALFTPGCSDNQPKVDAKLDEMTQRLFAPRKSPQQYMILAVSSEDADVRRASVVRISQSNKYDQEWAIKGFVAIACLENDPQTRCVAIRALARTGDPRATETALKVLNYRDYPPQEVRPPDDICRGDAAFALADLSAAGKVPEEYQDGVRKTLLDRLHLDTDRHTRIAAARGLASYPAEETVAGLIDALRDDDFAVVHQCENSLMKLTGQAHHGDVQAWEAWLAEHRDDLFAHAGDIPDSQRPPYKNNFEKSVYDTRELIRWLWPGAKEE